MRLLLSFIFVLFLAGCKSSPTYLNTVQLKQQYQTIGYAGFYVEEGLEAHKTHLKSHLQAPIKAALVKKGFEVMDASQVYKTYQQLLDSADNLYDPLTGQENENLKNDIWKQALAQTKAELGIDAFMFMGVDVVRAHFTHNIFLGKVARWHGQEESYLSDSASTGDAILSFMQGKQGYVPGSRVYIRFRDEQNNLLSIGAGGIELVAQFNGDGEIEVKPADKIFKDTAKFDSAIQFALLELEKHKGKK